MLSTKILAPIGFRVNVERKPNGAWKAACRQQTLAGPLGITEQRDGTALDAVRVGIAAVAQIDRTHNDLASAPVVFIYPHAA